MPLRLLSQSIFPPRHAAPRHATHTRHNHSLHPLSTNGGQAGRRADGQMGGREGKRKKKKKKRKKRTKNKKQDKTDKKKRQKVYISQVDPIPSFLPHSASILQSCGCVSFFLFFFFSSSSPISGLHKVGNSRRIERLMGICSIITIISYRFPKAGAGLRGDKR